MVTLIALTRDGSIPVQRYRTPHLALRDVRQHWQGPEDGFVVSDGRQTVATVIRSPSDPALCRIVHANGGVQTLRLGS